MIRADQVDSMFLPCWLPPLSPPFIVAKTASPRPAVHQVLSGDCRRSGARSCRQIAGSRSGRVCILPGRRPGEQQRFPALRPVWRGLTFAAPALHLSIATGMERPAAQESHPPPARLSPTPGGQHDVDRSEASRPVLRLDARRESGSLRSGAVVSASCVEEAMRDGPDVLAP